MSFNPNSPRKHFNKIIFLSQKIVTVTPKQSKKDETNIPNSKKYLPGGEKQEGGHHQKVEQVSERVEPDYSEDLAQHVEDHGHGGQGDGGVGGLEDVLALVVGLVVAVRLLDFAFELKKE